MPAPPSPRRSSPTRIPIDVEHALGHPLVDFAFVFRGGSATDPIGQEGRLALTLKCMLRGAGSHSATAFEREIDRLGAEVEVEVDPDSARFHVTVLARNAEAVFALLAEALTAPRFTPVEVSRQRRAMVADIVDARNDDDDLASRAFCRVLFSGHPYGRPAYGSVVTLERLDRNSLVRTHRDLLGRRNLLIGAAGPLDAEALERLVDRYLSGLHEGSSSPRFPATPRRVRGRTVLLLDKPERTRHAILVGGLGTDPHDRDHFALMVANTVFGGMFTSRLSQELRVRRGWAYDVHSTLSRGRSRQSFAMAAMPSSTDLCGTLSLLTKLLERWIEHGVTDREVALAKRFLAQSFAFEIDTPVKRLEHRVITTLWDLPKTYYTTQAESIAAVSTREASEAVRARLSSDDLLYALVATASDHRAGIERSVPRLRDTYVHPYGEDIPVGGLDHWSHGRE